MLGDLKKSVGGQQEILIIGHTFLNLECTDEGGGGVRIEYIFHRNPDGSCLNLHKG
jgi:hypothetical protein